MEKVNKSKIVEKTSSEQIPGLKGKSPQTSERSLMSKGSTAVKEQTKLDGYEQANRKVCSPIKNKQKAEHTVKTGT